MSEQTTLGNSTGSVVWQNRMRFILFIRAKRKSANNRNERMNQNRNGKLGSMHFPSAIPWIIVMLRWGVAARKLDLYRFTSKLRWRRTYYSLQISTVLHLIIIIFVVSGKHTPTRDWWNFYVQSSVLFVYISNQKEVYCAMLHGFPFGEA